MRPLGNQLGDQLGDKLGNVKPLAHGDETDAKLKFSVSCAMIEEDPRPS